MNTNYTQQDYNTAYRAYRIIRNAARNLQADYASCNINAAMSDLCAINKQAKAAALVSFAANNN